MATSKLSAAIFASAMVLACSDPKEATESNFKKAIQQHLDASYPRCLLTLTFPAESLKYDYSGVNEGLRALAKAGLLSEKEETRKEVIGFFKETRKVYTYDLTDDGRKYYQAGEKKAPTTGFCVGRATVVEIARFTEPADLFGHRVSQVTYTYRVDDLPEWAKRPDVVREFAPLKAWERAGKEPLRATEAVILTNKGWVHEKHVKEI